MIDKYLTKENVKPEHITDAYNYLKQYADENNTTVNKILSDTDNIPVAAEYIHKNLGFLVRKILSKDKITKLITDNFDFIKEEAQKIEGVPAQKLEKTKKTKK